MTLSEWMRSAAARLAAAGIAAPEQDARRLAAHGLGVEWSGLWSRLRDGVDAERLDALVARREAWEPLAYILGSATFYGHTLQVGPGVLIPRPETETLVDVGLRLGGDVIVDVCTGSGAVAIALAAGRPATRVIATDIDPLALSYARRNVAASGARVTLVRCHLAEAICGPVDLIVSNPPYVPEGAVLPRDVLAEPPIALFAADAGARLLLELVRHARSTLTPGGALALEIGSPDQAAGTYTAFEGWSERGVATDAFGAPRVVWGRR